MGYKILYWAAAGAGGDQSAGGSRDILLLEDGQFGILLEDGSYILLESAAPAWILTSGTDESILDIDFLNDRAYNAPFEVTIPSLLSCTRATPAAAYYTKADGTLTTFAANTLRYGTNGLLVEEARTNDVTRSQEFDSGNWSKDSLTATADQLAAPDGTTTADLITSTGTAASIFENPTLTSGIPYAWSSYAKLGTSTYIWFNAFDGSDHRTWFNLSTGTVGTNAAGNTASIEALANGWYRCIVIRTTGSTNCLYNIGLSDTDNSITTAVGRTTYLWGAQLEAGAFTTSYIPTTTVSVTRASDVVSMLTSGISGFSATAGTYYSQAQKLVAGITGRTLASISDGSGNEYFEVYDNAGNVGLEVLDGGAGQVSINTVVTDGSLYKAAAAWAANDFAMVTNGGAVGTDATGTLPTVTTLKVGVRYDSALTFYCGYIKRLAYWPIRLANGALQTLTT